jgi:hypothetical protein
MDYDWASADDTICNDHQTKSFDAATLTHLSQTVTLSGGSKRGVCTAEVLITAIS